MAFFANKPDLEIIQTNYSNYNNVSDKIMISHIWKPIQNSKKNVQFVT